MFNCSYCNHAFSTKTSLISHQKTAKYCLKIQASEGIDIKFLFTCDFCSKILSQQIDLDRHQLKCSSKKEADNNNKHELIIKELENKLSLKDKLIKKIRIENTQKLLEKDKIIEIQKKDLQEHKSVIKELQEEYKKQMEMQNKDLQDRMQSMAEKAIAKPSSFNQIINNLLPITTEHLNDQVQYLTIDHVKNGAIGYAKYALEHPLKDRLVCTDTSRKKGKYKDSDGNIVSDPEMSSITKKLFLAIKDRNSELITEYANDLKVKLDSFGSDNNEMTNEETVEINGITDDLIDLVTSVFSQKRQSNEISDGLKPELFHQFVKEISTGSYRSN
jgi:hypothetical protein